MIACYVIMYEYRFFRIYANDHNVISNSKLLVDLKRLNLRSTKNKNVNMTTNEQLNWSDRAPDRCHVAI